MAIQDQPGAGGDWWTTNGVPVIDLPTGGGTNVVTAPPSTAGPVISNPAGTFTGTPTPPGSPAFSSSAPTPSAYLTPGSQGGTAQSVMQGLLAKGVDPNTAIQQVNAQFGLQSGSSYAWRSIPGAPGGGVVEVPGGSYFAPGPDGAWGYNQGDSGASSSGGTSNQFAALANGGLPALDAVPAPYASNPNAPQFSSLSTPTDLSTPFTLPTATDLTSMPGYQVALNTGLQQINRSAAAQGTVLNPGTVQELNRYGTDYAGTQYANLVGESLAARGENNTEFQQAQSTNTQLQQNQYSQYLSQNAQALSDYLTNYNINHTATTDYWNQLKDVNGAGLTAAGALPTG